MTKEQHEKLIEEVTHTVRVVVNGKIDTIDKKLGDYIKKDESWKVTVEAFMTSMTPVRDGLHTVQSLNKFFKWLGLPALGAFLFYWFTK